MAKVRLIDQKCVNEDSFKFLGKGAPKMSPSNLSFFSQTARLKEYRNECSEFGMIQ